GVIKAHRPVISCCEHPEAVDVVRQTCRTLGSDLMELPAVAPPASMEATADGQYVFDLALNGDRFSGLKPALRGRFQMKNAMAAVAAACRLSREGVDIPRSAIETGLRSARWPGRLEAVGTTPLVLLDGAHNPAAARELADFIRENYKDRRLRLIYA